MEDVLPMGDWVEFLETQFDGKPLLVHLRFGYERAVLMPEPVKVKNENHTLTRTDVVIGNRVVTFYPMKEFGWSLIEFVGLDSGTVYELRIKASPMGKRQPIRINR